MLEEEKTNFNSYFKTFTKLVILHLNILHHLNLKSFRNIQIQFKERLNNL